jgi:glycosyltransferase involved in cell wall biosynthesis
VQAPRGLVTFLVPAKDEEAAIGRTLRQLPLATLRAMGYRTTTLVLDGASRDRTAQVARAAGATVVQDRRPGKGNAFRDAIPLATGAYVVLVDADATYAPDAIPLLLEPLARGQADCAMGLRRPRKGAMTPLHRAGNAAFSAAATLLYGHRARDVCTGLWAFRADALRRLPLRSQRFGLEVELFALASRLGLRVAQVDVDYLPRHGRAKLRSVRDGARIARRLVASRFVRLPRRLPTAPPAAESFDAIAGGAP